MVFEDRALKCDGFRWAAEIGVDPTTVKCARDNATAAGATVVEKRVGLDRKARKQPPATRSIGAVLLA
jgi:hypothetical protein